MRDPSPSPSIPLTVPLLLLVLLVLVKVVPRLCARLVDLLLGLVEHVKRLLPVRPRTLLPLPVPVPGPVRGIAGVLLVTVVRAEAHGAHARLPVVVEVKRAVLRVGDTAPVPVLRVVYGRNLAAPGEGHASALRISLLLLLLLWHVHLLLRRERARSS